MTTIDATRATARSADRVVFGHTSGPVGVLRVSGIAAASMLLTSITWAQVGPARVVAGSDVLTYGGGVPVSSKHDGLLVLTGEPMDGEDLAAWNDADFRASMERSLEDFYAGRLVDDDDLFEVEADDETV